MRELYIFFILNKEEITLSQENLFVTIFGFINNFCKYLLKPDKSDTIYVCNSKKLCPSIIRGVLAKGLPEKTIRTNEEYLLKDKTIYKLKDNWIIQDYLKPLNTSWKKSRKRSQYRTLQKAGEGPCLIKPKYM